MIEFTIEGAFYKKNCFVGLNDYIRNISYNRYAGGNFKNKYKNIAKQFIKQQVKSKCINQPIKIIFEFGEISKKRDYDNIMSFAIKVILDSLQEANIIKNDNQKIVKDITAKFIYSKKPYIKVKIDEV